MCFPWDASETFCLSMEQWTEFIQHREEIHWWFNSWITSQWLALPLTNMIFRRYNKGQRRTEVPRYLSYLMMGIQILGGGWRRDLRNTSPACSVMDYLLACEAWIIGWWLFPATYREPGCHLKLFGVRKKSDHPILSCLFPDSRFRKHSIHWVQS